MAKPRSELCSTTGVRR